MSQTARSLRRCRPVLNVPARSRWPTGGQHDGMSGSSSNSAVVSDTRGCGEFGSSTFGEALMTNRRNVTGGPARHVVAGAFPDAEWDASAPSAVWWAAEIARRLQCALAGRSISAVARDADVGRQTLYDVLRGRTWPDVVTIVRLQDALDVVLWPEWAPGRPPAADASALVVDLEPARQVELGKAG